MVQRTIAQTHRQRQVRLRWKARLVQAGAPRRSVQCQPDPGAELDFVTLYTSVTINKVKDQVQVNKKGPVV